MSSHRYSLFLVGATYLVRSVIAEPGEHSGLLQCELEIQDVSKAARPGAELLFGFGYSGFSAFRQGRVHHGGTVGHRGLTSSLLKTLCCSVVLWFFFLVYCVPSELSGGVDVVNRFQSALIMIALAMV